VRAVDTSVLVRYYLWDYSAQGAQILSAGDVFVPKTVYTHRTLEETRGG
jgi:hypothetical protein